MGSLSLSFAPFLLFSVTLMNFAEIRLRSHCDSSIIDRQTINFQFLRTSTVTSNFLLQIFLSIARNTRLYFKKLKKKNLVTTQSFKSTSGVEYTIVNYTIADALNEWCWPFAAKRMKKKKKRYRIVFRLYICVEPRFFPIFSLLFYDMRSGCNLYVSSK